LIGPTGSGKTTIISLLQRFYDPQRGRILIDGIDIREFDKQQLRKRIGVVPQDIYLFSGNLTDNLAMGGQYDSAAVERTAQRTLASRFVDRLPDGYQTILAERGANLSLGQRQLLSFTRALLRDPDIVILDEATSAVDPATEAAVNAATRQSLANRTAIIIAHRLSTIRDADQILVMDDGQIIQSGTHNELIRQSGLYQTLQRLQQMEELGSA
jgi:ATP-binding cassette subfamily B protein